jgi:hypothetical protein
MDANVFANGMARLAAAHAGRHLDETVIETYRWGLAGISDVDFLRAIERAIRETTFFPSVGELRTLAVGDVKARAAASLRSVRAVMGSYSGPRFTPRSAWDGFDAPTRAGISAAGGLAAIWESTDQFALERVFGEAYSGAVTPQPALSAKVVGRIGTGT